MNYKITIEKNALKFIMKQPQQQRERLLSAISKLPDNGDRKVMQGRPGYYRLRVGDYRVIYTFEREKLIIRIVSAGNRGDVYK